MVDLVNCIECGKKVSSEAKCCPHCGKDPRTIGCFVCNEPVRYSQKVHPECDRSLHFFSCQACHKSFNYDKYFNETPPSDDCYEGRHSGTCPYCGHIFYFWKCDLCGRQVLEAEAKRRGEIPYNHYHSLCDKKRSKCFIATAIYDSPSAREVLLLKSFRDNTLMSSYFGRQFIKFYYYISPPIANFLSKHAFWKKLVKYGLLEPFLRLIKYRKN